MLASPSTSPPRTPNDRRVSPHLKSTPNSDDSSIIDDLSFDYIQDSNGNIVRLSKGSSSKSNHSSPPTPQDAIQPDIPTICKPESPNSLHESPMARIALSRSESAYSALPGSSAAVQSERSARSFQRVASGPVLSQTPYLAPPPPGSKPRVAARRITTEDASERQDSGGVSRAKLMSDLNAYSHTLQEEKENISESDEIPIIQTASVAKKHRNSPPLATRSTSALSIRTSSVANRANYGSNRSSNRPLADVSLAQRSVQVRQVVPAPNRSTRMMKSSSLSKYNSSAFDRISETEGSDVDQHYVPIPTTGEDDTDAEDDVPPTVDPAAVPLPISSNSLARPRSTTNALSLSGGSRPRRSASLSDALKHDDYQLQLEQQYREKISRPGTGSGFSSDGVPGGRRIAPQNLELRTDYKHYRSSDEAQQSRQSPSPTQSQAAAYPSRATHKRRDSDTLRPSVSTSTGLSSPTIVESHRVSPPGSRFQVRYSPPTSSKGRTSPPSSNDRLNPPVAILKGRTSPTTKGRLSPASVSSVVRDIARHRRSPTAPEPNAAIWDRGEKEEEHGYASAGERAREREKEKEQETEKERERERKWQQVQQSQQHQQNQQQQHFLAPPPSSAPPVPQATGPAPPPPTQLNRHMTVNKKAYARLDLIGKGGSSRVFRVLSPANELYAIKRVTLDKTDSETMNGYMNEIALLKRLDGNNRIIQLIDSEVKPGPGGSKGHLLLVMECGEVDLARLLQEQMKEPVNMVWVAYYWQQMLQAVHVIHEEKIVHSDLKPANFVLVRGQLKLIDFGIANAIANDTTNIQRDHQMGTVNYMSPEAIELPDGMRRLKVGRPSDVWSLGCILYQMVYGFPPFQHLSMIQKMRAIPDLAYIIDFPEYAVPIVPSPKSSGDGPVEPPKKLDHLKQQVRKDVIMSMKSCLCRTPKERATIPELLNDTWLSLSEPATPPAKDLLKENEAIIDPYYMHQLLEYGIKLASEGGLDARSLLKDAERLVQELKAIQA